MIVWVGVAVLGGVGAYARFALATWVSGGLPGSFPWGTFAVNLAGSFALGLLTGLTVTGDALLLLGTGLIGAFTTFSTWMVEAQRLGEEGELGVLAAYLVASLLAGLAAAGLGWAIA
jgi:CrcB protein